MASPCDEPTSAVSPEMVKKVLDTIISRAQDGMTMVFITHETGSRDHVADRATFVGSGEILEGRFPETFFRNPAHPHALMFQGEILALQ